jgi:AmmeMemoRadiSam system protein B
MRREPVVAGHFYEKKKNLLEKQIKLLLPQEKQKIKVKGIVSPHAGYMYSGKVAAEVYASIEIPELCIIMGPNHTGLGHPFSIYSEGIWNTPFGDVEIDEKFANELIKNSNLLIPDITAHEEEHSIEVQIPFIQFFSSNFKIVPICIKSNNINSLKELGETIANTITSLKKDALIIASSDMNHYEPQEITKKKDQIAIDAILKLDENELIEKVNKNNISMCGIAPTYAMLVAVKKLGAKKAKLIKYMTSGDISGDFSYVVGYAGIVIE